jgi:hypothetical protein
MVCIPFMFTFFHSLLLMKNFIASKLDVVIPPAIETRDDSTTLEGENCPHNFLIEILVQPDADETNGMGCSILTGE